MSVHFDLVTIDSSHTERLAAFWAAVLGLAESEREDGDRWIVLSSSDGVRRIGLQRGEHRSGTVHLDLACGPDEFAAERDRILALGATETRPPRVEHYGSIANFVDLDGNLFDLCAYTA